MCLAIHVSPFTIFGPKENQLYDPSLFVNREGPATEESRPHDPLDANAQAQPGTRLDLAQAHLEAIRGRPWRDWDLEIPWGFLGMSRPTFWISGNPTFRNVETYDPDIWRPMFWVQEDPRFGGVETPRSGYRETHDKRISSVHIRKKPILTLTINTHGHLGIL